MLHPPQRWAAMDIDIVCPKCSARMVDRNYGNEPMYCLVCGTQGDMITHGSQFNNVKGKRNTRSRASPVTHIARYKEAKGRTGHPELKDMTLKYRLAHRRSHDEGAFPALLLECPHCGRETLSQAWVKSRWEPRRAAIERYIYVECPSGHTYSIVCDSSGDYYWR